MKPLVIVVLCCCSCMLFAQQEVPSPTVKDSAHIRKFEPVRRLSFNLEWGLVNMPGSTDNLFLGRKLRLSSQPFGFPDNNSAKNMLRPLQLQYLEQQRLAPYYYILGTLEAGATGYLLYQHLKKHSDLY